MSEPDVRPAPTRGRSSNRGGRAGFGRGGPRGGRKVNGTSTDARSVEDSLDEQGELGEMKKKYINDLPPLRDMFPDWTDTDLVFALQEADGDIAATADKIANGEVSQFSEVKKPKDRARSKVKEEPAAAGAADKSSLGTRSGRGRGGFEGARGARGRGSERGRGAHRGGRGGHASINGTIKESGAESVPTTESSAWDTSATTTNAGGGWDSSATDTVTKEAAHAGQSSGGNVASSESAPVVASEATKSKLVPEGAQKKSWASMFKAAPTPVPVKQILTKQPPPAEPAPPAEIPESMSAQIDQTVDSLAVEATATEPEPTPPAPPILEPEHQIAPQPVEALVERPTTAESEGLSLTPSKDPLTEENVEHLPDESHPPATQTVASTIGSADPRNLTPLPSQSAPIGRPPMGGYATAANRLAGTGVRSASFQRRVQEQQEAVVMPGHNALDRAAVQFGSMGLNSEPGLDVDEEREEPETRQAPQHSPPSQPRTSLPPAPRQTVHPHEASMPEALPTPKQAPGLPPASIQNQQQIQDPSLTQGLQQEQQVNQGYNQYGRYGQQSLQQDTGAQQQKPYDPFGHQAQQEQFNQYGAQSHQPQPQSQSGFGGLSSAPSEYSSYYTSDQPRNAYNQYYGNAFGPQETRNQGAPPPPSQHEAAISQQRSASGFGAGHNEHAYGQQAAQQTQSRFGDPPGSGNNTPNPIMSSQQQQGPAAQQSQHSMHQAQGHQQGYGATPGYPYGHPYYSSPYQQAYQNQFGYTPPVGSYGGSGFPGKQANMYGAQHGYGMGSQSSYDQHSSSPANASAFSQNQQNSMRSTSGMSSSLGGPDEYGRGSAQSASHQSSGFGGMNDPFARSASGFGSQGYNQQNMSAGPEDSLKPFTDTKSGPSPAIGQPGRPDSAANSAAATSQTGLPPPQGQHSGFGGYPGFPGQGNQYGGLGGLGGHQQGQGGMGGQSAYGSYGGGFSQYGGYGASRGSGWGANYTQH